MTILKVAFYGQVVGWIDTKGPKHNWQSANTDLARFLENSRPGQLPNTFKYLQPEGWLARVLSGEQEAYVEAGIRFLSNLTIIEAGEKALDKVGIDTLHDRLLNCTAPDGAFTGIYRGPSAPHFNPAFESTVANLWKNELMPKFSGAQIKIPVSLIPDHGGSHVLTPAVNTTFSHILKVPREGYYASLPAVEWAGLKMAQEAGLPTAAHALVEMPDGMAPALVVERFDIPDIEDRLDELTRISDFCNITDTPPDKKYGADISMCFAALEKQSSRSQEDKILLFKRLVLSHYILDGDMHLKNLSVLKTFDTQTGNISVRFAPVYDAMTTAIYPELDDGKSALKYDPNPEHGGLSAQDISSYSDLMKIAEINGIPWKEADEIIKQISESVLETAVKIVRNPPEILKNHPACLHALKRMATEIHFAVNPDVPLLSDEEMTWDTYEEPASSPPAITAQFSPIAAPRGP